MIGNIRTWMFNKTLKEHQNYNQKGQHYRVNNCQSVCIIADGSSESNKKATEEYIQVLQSHHKKVDTLYFVDEKVPSDIGYSRHAIKWNGIPQNELIDDILSKEYDILFYFHHTIEDHLRYIATLCNARFKIGPAFAEYSYIFDLMVDIDDYSNTKLLIKAIDKQLRMLSI